MSKDRKPKSYKPDWVPENAGEGFATRVLKGVSPKNQGKIRSVHKKRHILEISDYVNGVLRNERTILARTITLIESNSSQHNETAKNVLRELLPFSGKSIRIGITGVPGAGKSTLIESFGLYLIKEGHKVAVLAIDPSSTLTKGSILGDKTRMEKLAREEGCFIRPSPTGGTLGGVARKTRETMLVCEAAGYDVILIETVGVGQSEVTVRSMVDFFLLVMIAGAGDELQGIKKGVMELADSVLINKADGENIRKARLACNDINMALHYIQPSTKGWDTTAGICSALSGEGIPGIWEQVNKFREITGKNGTFDERRKSQTIDWMFKMIDEGLTNNFYQNEKVKNLIKIIKQKVIEGKLLATEGAEELLKFGKEAV